MRRMLVIGELKLIVFEIFNDADPAEQFLFQGLVGSVHYSDVLSNLERCASNIDEMRIRVHTYLALAAFAFLAFFRLIWYWTRLFCGRLSS